MLLGVVNAENVDRYRDLSISSSPSPWPIGRDAIFTGASANTAIPPDFYHDPSDLAQIDWAAIDSKKWGNVDEDFRHRRMAELLVHGQLPVTAATRCVVWNEAAKKRVEAIVGTEGVSRPSSIRTNGRVRIGS